MNLGFTEIEDRLRKLRRRLNSLAVQHVLYVSGSAMALATALLVVVALWFRPWAFNVTFWVVLVIVAACLAAAAYQLRRRWLSLERVVRWADREARLDDRLATLVGQRAHPQASRLAVLLVGQVLALRQRWQPQTLVRRHVPRSVYLFAASLTALIVTAFFARPPAAPVPHSFAVASHERSGSAERPEGGTLLRPSAEEGQGDDGLTYMAGNVPGGRHPSKSGQGGGAAGGTRGNPNRGETTNAIERPNDPLTDRLRSAIRSKLGAQPPESRGGMGERQTRRHAPQEPRQPGTDPQPGKAGTAPGDQAQQGNPADPQRQAATATKKEGASSGSGSAAGGSGGQGPGGVLAVRRETGDAATQAKTFPLNLTSLTFAVRSLMEPQSPTQKQPDETTAQTAPSETEPSEYDRPDDPVLRPAIAPEYEPVVRRLFSRE